MKKRHILGMLFMVMVLSFTAACGNSETNTPTAENAQSSKVSTSEPDSMSAGDASDTSIASEQTDEGSVDGYHTTWDDTEEITVVWPTMGSIPSGLQAVEDAINEISEAEIDVHVHLKPFEVGGYEQQINLMISSGEPMDLMVTFPAYRSYVSGIFIMMRTDVLDDLGLREKAEQLTFGSSYVGVADGDTSASVVNLFGTEAYYNNYQLVKDWYDAGYVYRNANTATELGNSLVKSGVAFSYLTMTEKTVAEKVQTFYDETCGREMTMVLIHDLPISTSTLTKFTWGIPVTSKSPEAAAAFLELFFNNAQVANLFAWGIEGVDYQINEDGVACYIEGNETPAYHGVEFLNANCFHILPWEGADPQLRQIQKKLMDEASLSEYFGFTCETDAITNQITAMTNAVSEYGAQINSGMADEDSFQSFLAKLEAGDIQTIIDLYQTKLDAWRAAE